MKANTHSRRSKITATVAALTMGGGISLLALAPAFAATGTMPGIDSAETGAIVITKYVSTAGVSSSAVAPVGTPVAGPPTGFTAKAGADFQVCPVTAYSTLHTLAGLSVQNSDWWAAAANIVADFNAAATATSPTTAAGNLLPTPSGACATVTTVGTEGEAIFDASGSGMGLGLYVVRELPTSAMAGYVLAEPFLITLPYQDGSGAWIKNDLINGHTSATGDYIVWAYPKNAQFPTVDKTSDPSAIYAGGTVIHYAVNTTIPNLPAPGGGSAMHEFTLKDVLGVGLNWATPLNLSISIGSVPYVMAYPTEYTFTYSTTSFADDTLTVSLTPAGVAKVNTYDPLTGIVINYDAVVTSLTGAAVTNTATVNWDSSTKPDPEVVYFGGIPIHKYDSVGGTTVHLNGAVFKVSTTDPAGTATFIQSGGTDATFVTAGTGDVTINGLPYYHTATQPAPLTHCTAGGLDGTTYWLVETTPPTSYTITNPVTEVCVTGDGSTNYVLNAAVNIPNTIKNIGITLPFTGEFGKSAPVLLGLFFTVGAFTVWVVRTKKINTRKALG